MKQQRRLKTYFFNGDCELLMKPLESTLKSGKADAARSKRRLLLLDDERGWQLGGINVSDVE